MSGVSREVHARRSSKGPCSSDLEVAVIGDFQIGKSTFVNCLLGRNAAKTGQGCSTTHKFVPYLVGNGVSILDTPGFNAPGAGGCHDEAEARAAIRRAFAVVVYQDKAMGDLCRGLIRDEVIAHGKRCIFVYNCTNRSRWSPLENADICRAIEADLNNCGYADFCIKLGTSSVHPVNALWAMYGLGLLDDEKEKRKIVRYARDDLGLDASVNLQQEMLRLSRLPEVRQFVQELPLEVVSDFLKNKSREVKVMADRFREELAMRLSGRKGR